MNMYSRAGFKWSVNEILSLQREFELLEWNIDQIALKHKRTPDAIMYKLDEEGFADFNVLYSNYHDLNAPIQVERKASSALNLLSDYDDNEETVCDDDTDKDYSYNEDEDEDEDYEDEDYEDEDYEDDDDHDEEDEIANLSQRVDGLEEGISEIRNMLKQMIGSFTNQNLKFSGCV